MLQHGGGTRKICQEKTRLAIRRGSNIYTVLASLACMKLGASLSRIQTHPLTFALPLLIQGNCYTKMTTSAWNVDTVLLKDASLASGGGALLYFFAALALASVVFLSYALSVQAMHQWKKRHSPTNVRSVCFFPRILALRHSS